MINFNVLLDKFKLTDRQRKRKFLKDFVLSKSFELGELNYIFMSDDELLKINIEYLDHDTFTDIITFDNSETEGVIEGDIFISVERVRENALKFQVDFERELVRVMAHGVLHLLGYKDKTEGEANEMRKEEEKAISQYFQSL